MIGAGPIHSSNLDDLAATPLIANQPTGASRSDGQQKTDLPAGSLSMPLALTANQGQWDDSVLFRADADGATFWFTGSGVYYQFSRRSDDIAIDSSSGKRSAVGANQYETMMIKASFEGSNARAQVVGENLLSFRSNFFIGNDRAAWRTDVANYQSVVYEEIYSGIDLKYYGSEKQMEYDFVVSPGADPTQIKVRYDGTQELAVSSSGHLIITTEWGEVIEQPPIVYQLADGRRQSVACRYVLRDDRTFGFEIGDDYDRMLAVVIDPVLSYSTYLGGSSDDYGAQIAVDSDGNTYITGSTLSTNFPTFNPVQGTHGGGYYDIFVTKLNATGTALLFSTFLGGSREDFGWGIVVDTFGEVYVTGESWSSDFPTLNGYQNTYGGGACDAYLFKLNRYGNGLVFSTYLGGNGEDYSSSFKIDDSGNAYLAGSTASTNFPVVNAWQSVNGGGARDAFAAKLNSAGDELRYSTYLGGSGLDWGRGIDIDSIGNAYIGGYTSSPNFPVHNAFQGAYGGGANDVFVTKLNPSGDTVVYSTYLGGELDDAGWSIAVDATGKAHVCGKTNSTAFPTTPNAFQVTYGGGASDAFFTALNSAGDGLHYSTYLGGTGAEQAWDAMIDMYGNALLAGATGSLDFP